MLFPVAKRVYERIAVRVFNLDARRKSSPKSGDFCFIGFKNAFYKQSGGSALGGGAKAKNNLGLAAQALDTVDKSHYRGVVFAESGLGQSRTSKNMINPFEYAAGFNSQRFAVGFNNTNLFLAATGVSAIPAKIVFVFRKA